MKNLLFVLLFGLISCRHADGNLSIVAVDPVFTVGHSAPTEDKPQSKIWYDQNSWWTLLPTAGGLALWKRTPQGWVEDKAVRKALQGQPGKADVWHDAGTVMAVLVGDCELKILQLVASASGYETNMLASLPTSEACASIETATIAKDNAGTWWVASDMNNSIAVWSSADGITWSLPTVLADDINKDDICVITALPQKISVIWSNQDQEAVMERTHANGAPVAGWSAPQIVEQGNHTADDHLNTTLMADGTLVVVSKNSLDERNKPQFVLRVKSPAGNWENYPYADLTDAAMPTRPVVTHTDGGLLITAYAVKDPDTTDNYHIAIATVVPVGGGWTVTEKLWVKAKGVSTVNNVTVSKQPFSADQPWLLLFSDQEGNVYECDLSAYKAFKHQ